jgi:hypothetical protein
MSNWAIALDWQARFALGRRPGNADQRRFRGFGKEGRGAMQVRLRYAGVMRRVKNERTSAHPLLTVSRIGGTILASEGEVYLCRLVCVLFRDLFIRRSSSYVLPRRAGSGL